MRGRYCYLPILPARGGAFRAVESLSPTARSRLTPLFDVPSPVLEPGDSIDDYLVRRAEAIVRCWGRERAPYIDVCNFPLELRTQEGRQPISFLLDAIRASGGKAIPVTGSESERGQDYLRCVRLLSARDRSGVCLRLQREDFPDPAMTSSTLSAILDALALSPAEVDLVLDFRFVGGGDIQALRVTAMEALQTIHRVGAFRNIALAGGSIPERLSKRDNGRIRRERRVEVDLWVDVTKAATGQHAIAFGDFGVVGPHYAPPKGPVTVPARVRYTTSTEQILLRGARNEYANLCEQLVALPEYRGNRYSVGDRELSRVAKRQARSNSPSLWVSADTNQHLEFVSSQVWNFIKHEGLSDGFHLPEVDRLPWLQTELV